MKMNKTILLQMQQLISRYDFEKSVTLYKCDKGVRSFSTWNLLQVLMFAQLSAKKSLRDICDTLRAKNNYWYHLGLESISRNNLSHSMMNRPAQIFEETFYKLLVKFKNERGYLKDKRFKFKNPLKSFDSTTISLCLSLFNWADFRQTKGGIKLHVMMDNRTQVPDFLIMTEAKQHDVKIAEKLVFQKNSIYVFDRGYFKYELFQKIAKNRAFFVTRTKSNTQYKIIERQKKTDSCIKADWIVKVSGVRKDECPDNLRVIRYYDSETNRVFEYMTNNFNLSAKTIADIYKARWDIELFFKWIKQNLKIKTFIGITRNAVLMQIWAAMIVFVLIQYIKFLSRSSFSILTVFRLIGDNLFTKKDLNDLLNGSSITPKKKKSCFDFQLDFCW